jgi:hypothetical protein
MTTETREHALLSPSMLDALALCPCYRRVEGGESSEAAERGRKMHGGLTNFLLGAQLTNMGFSSDEEEEIRWAAEWVHLSCDNRVYEERVTIERDFEILTWGYLDIADTTPSSLTVVDFKTGEQRDCTYQLGAYALGLMQRYEQPQCRVVALFSRYRYVEEWIISRERAEALVYPILDAARDPKSQPRPNGYCPWCANRWNCYAQHNAGTAIVHANPEFAETSDWLPSTWRPSEITEPSDMAKLLEIRAVMKKGFEEWDKAVTAHALAMSATQEIPGWRRAEVKSDREVKEILNAFQASGLKDNEFLACCKVKIGELEKMYAKDADNKAAAKRELAMKIEPFLAKRTTSWQLKPEKQY